MASTNTHNSDAKPRCPRSGYNFFFKEQAPKISAMILRESGKKGTYTQLSAAVLKQWNEADHTKRAHYQSLAVQDKRRYGLELVQWRIQQEERREESGWFSTEEKQKKRKKENHAKRKDITSKPIKNYPRQTLDYEMQDQQALQDVTMPIPFVWSPPNSMADAQSDIWTRDLNEILRAR